MTAPADARPIRLNLRVSPGGSRAAVVGRHGDAWKVRVVGSTRSEDARTTPSSRSSPRRSGFSRPDVRIVSGAALENKTVELVGLTRDEAESRLTDAQEGAP